MEKENHQTNIIISGVPERTYAERGSGSGDEDDQTGHVSVMLTVCNMFKEEMSLDIDPSTDVKTAFQMKAGKKYKYSPIMVKLASNDVKSTIMTEHLTKAAADRFAITRKLVKEKKIAHTWTFNGNVFVKITNEQNAQPKLIRSITDLPPNISITNEQNSEA